MIESVSIRRIRRFLEAVLHALDPGPHVGGAGVDSGEVGLSAADAPRHDADLDPVVTLGKHQRTAAITLKKKELGHLLIFLAARIYALSELRDIQN